MSKKKLDTASIKNELEGASAFFPSPPSLAVQQKKNDNKTLPLPQKPKPKERVSQPPHIDVVTSPTDVVTSYQVEKDKLLTIIRSVSKIPTSAQNTPVRLSEQEKKDIDEFIHGTLRRAGLTGNTVSASKLMRYSLRYLMKVHEKEFITALQAALKRDTALPI